MDCPTHNYTDLSQPFQLPNLGDAYHHSKYESSWRWFKMPSPPQAHQQPPPHVFPATDDFSPPSLSRLSVPHSWPMDSGQISRLSQRPITPSEHADLQALELSRPLIDFDSHSNESVEQKLSVTANYNSPHEKKAFNFESSLPDSKQQRSPIEHYEFKPLEEQRKKVSPRVPCQKQTHQALREALTKRRLSLPVDQPWSSASAAHSRASVDNEPEGAHTSSSLSSPSSSDGSQTEPRTDNAKVSDGECHKKRPLMSYMQLIQMALNSVPDKRMNLQQIYTWIEDHYPYFKLYARKGWKNSVRHNLSLYDIFVREKPDPNEEWKFSYWCLRPENAPNGATSASKRDHDKAEKMASEGLGRKHTDSSRPRRAIIPGLPLVNDYVVAVPPSMQQSGSRPLLPRSTSDTLAVIPLDYMYQLPVSSGGFGCTTPMTQIGTVSMDLNASTTNVTGNGDSGYISLNGSILPVFPNHGQSFTAADPTYKLPDTIPTPRNLVKEASKRSTDEGGATSHDDKTARKSRRLCSEKPKKVKKRPKSEPHDIDTKENVFMQLEVDKVMAADLEENFSSPLRMLLQSPLRSNFTSTPFKDKPLSNLRVTPIKDSFPKGSSTPRLLPWECAFFSPGGKKYEDMSLLSNRSFNLSIPGLTPLKDREHGVDSGCNVSMMNDSLGRLLSDFQYDDNLLDCGVIPLPMDMDIGNASFSQITNLQQL